MQIVNDINPVTYLKNRAADVLKYMNETYRPMIITQNAEAKAVIQYPKSYEDIKNTLALMKLLSFAEEDSLSIARKVYGQIKEKAQSSNFFPLKGRLVPELLKD